MSSPGGGTCPSLNHAASGCSCAQPVGRSEPPAGGAIRSAGTRRLSPLAGRAQWAPPRCSGVLGGRTQDEVGRSLKAVKAQHRGEHTSAIRDGPPPTPATPAQSPARDADSALVAAGGAKQGGHGPSPGPRQLFPGGLGPAGQTVHRNCLLPCVLEQVHPPTPKVCNVFPKTAGKDAESAYL